MFNIEWVGDRVETFGSRLGNKPFVICNHISAGTKSSMRNTFENSANKVSAHFDVGRDGSIWQYVKIEDAAWTQGLTPDMIGAAKAPVVKDMNCNPNLYMVSIEFEGYIDRETNENHGIDGTLTEIQFMAGCWLHRYIMDYCNNKFGVRMDLGEYNVTGHCMVDPKRKPACPGINFPWARLRAELAIAERMTLKEYGMRLLDTGDRDSKMDRFLIAARRMTSLYNRASDKSFEYKDEALEKGLMIARFMKDNDLMDP